MAQRKVKNKYRTGFQQKGFGSPVHCSTCGGQDCYPRPLSPNDPQSEPGEIFDLNVEILTPFLTNGEWSGELKWYNYRDAEDHEEVNVSYLSKPMVWRLASFQASRQTIFAYYGILLRGQPAFNRLINNITANPQAREALRQDLPVVIRYAVGGIKHNLGGQA